MTDIRDGIAIVTGSTCGLGRALARELAEVMHVGAVASSQEGLQELAALNANITPLHSDVSDYDEIENLIENIEKSQAITCLVNIAPHDPRRDILQESARSFMATVNTNLGGTVATTRAVLSGMVARGFGRILNVSTFADVAPVPGTSAYAVSKGAARIFTRALVADLGDRFPGIVVNDWMPGILDGETGVRDGTPPETAAKWGAQLALWHDQSLTGTIWEQDRELPPPRSLKYRVAARIGLKPAARARQLPPPSPPEVTGQDGER